MKRYPRRLNVFLCLLTAFSSHFISPALADEKAKRVLILPLTIHSEKDLTFLNKGIMEMMAARIGRSANVLREDAPAPGGDPVQTGRDLNADYVVTGSLTVFGNSASTDAALTAVDSSDTVLQFSQFGQSSGDISDFSLTDLSGDGRLEVVVNHGPCTDVTQVKSRKGSSNRSSVYLESSGDRAILMYHHREGESIFLSEFCSAKNRPNPKRFLKICTQEPIVSLKILSYQHLYLTHHMLDCRCSLDNYANASRKRG